MLGRLANSDYDPVLFQKIGDVLSSMHDDDEAGRYYLLAGTSGTQSVELVQAFLTRRKSGSVDSIWSTMPSAARRLSAGGFPDATVEYLVDAGFERTTVTAFEDSQRRRHADRSTKEPASGSSSTATLAIYLLLGFVAVTFGLGLAKFGEIAIQAFRRVL